MTPPDGSALRAAGDTVVRDRTTAGLSRLLPVGTACGTTPVLLGPRPAAPLTARRLPEILTAVNKG
ncbi:hypothetical protein KYY02_00570 [Streptomyces pimonensis]|uniref:Uncharacterized protein n=1 Tax=Streptomyces pimonensis TaxID=2860288 RepID=A0ABV4IRG8_9ACTN